MPAMNDVESATKSARLLAVWVPIGLFFFATPALAANSTQPTEKRQANQSNCPAKPKCPQPACRTETPRREPGHNALDLWLQSGADQLLM